MKNKKIEDYTIGEAMKICAEHSDTCKGCPFLLYDTVYNFSYGAICDIQDGHFPAGWSTYAE